MATVSTLDTPPFEISFSSNVEEFIFNPGWDHRKHYQAVFNSQDALLSQRIPADKPWAMLADWRRWLVLAPENERLCVRSVHRFVALGMTHYALLADEHPVARWQAEKVKEANPSLEFLVSTDKQELYTWLEAAGFDTAFRPEPFRAEWMLPSAYFDEVLRDLHADPNHFETTPDFRPYYT